MLYLVLYIQTPIRIAFTSSVLQWSVKMFESKRQKKRISLTNHTNTNKTDSFDFPFIQTAFHSMIFNCVLVFIFVSHTFFLSSTLKIGQTSLSKWKDQKSHTLKIFVPTSHLTISLWHLISFRNHFMGVL